MTETDNPFADLELDDYSLAPDDGDDGVNVPPDLEEDDDSGD